MAGLGIEGAKLPRIGRAVSVVVSASAMRLPPATIIDSQRCGHRRQEHGDGSVKGVAGSSVASRRWVVTSEPIRTQDGHGSRRRQVVIG
jgi:hypothetical protein